MNLKKQFANFLRVKEGTLLNLQNHEDEFRFLLSQQFRESLSDRLRLFIGNLSPTHATRFSLP